MTCRISDYLHTNIYMFTKIYPCLWYREKGGFKCSKYVLIIFWVSSKKYLDVGCCKKITVLKMFRVITLFIKNLLVEKYVLE